MPIGKSGEVLSPITVTRHHFPDGTVVHRFARKVGTITHVYHHSSQDSGPGLGTDFKAAVDALDASSSAPPSMEGESAPHFSGVRVRRPRQ